MGRLTSCGPQLSCMVCAGHFLGSSPPPVLLSMELSFLYPSPPRPAPRIDFECKRFISVLLAVALDILCIFLISFPSPRPALIPVFDHSFNTDILSIYLVF